MATTASSSRLNNKQRFRFIPLQPDAKAYLQRLVDLSGAPQASFHVELDGQAQAATLVRGQHEMLPADRSRSSQPSPRPAERTSARPGDRSALTVPKDTDAIVYSVGSLTKIFINLAFYIAVSSGQYASLGLSWEKSACDMFNERRDYHKRSRIKKISRDPTIRELLLHRNGFAPMNHELFAPDGTFIMSEADFLEIAPRVTEAHFKGQMRGFSVYSNANHIFAGLLLEEIMGISLSEAMKKLVFGPLEMWHTVMDAASLQCLSAEGDTVARGHRVSGQMKVSALQPNHNYLKDKVEAASLGAYSSTEDIAKLFREFMKALDNKSEIFSEEDALDFFGPNCDYHDGGKVSLAGLFGDANSSLPGSESLQTTLVPGPHTFDHRIGKMSNGSPCKLYYKAGSIDGYTATLYISLRHRMFVIVLANCSGPVDVTEHIARYILQETLNLAPRINVEQDAWATSVRSCKKLSSLEQVEQADLSWQDSIDQFVGDAGFGIDSWSVWSDRDFVIQNRDDGIYLVNRSGSGLPSQHQKAHPPPRAGSLGTKMDHVIG
ncbi:hypothetical protein DV736_g3404, partial [Chaetothyriales sp. CBS 134916]